MTKLSRREEIIISAIKVFSNKNYNKATTAEIAKEAAISEGTLYKHFSSKKELFLECAQYIESMLFKRYRKIYEQYKDDHVEYLRRVALEYTIFVYENPAMSKFLAFMLTNTFDQDILKQLKHFIDMNVNTTVLMLENAKEGGKVNREMDVEAASWFYVGGYFTIVLMSEFGYSKEKCLSIVGNLSDQLLK